MIFFSLDHDLVGKNDIDSAKMHVKGLKGCVSEENCRLKCKL